MSLLGIFIITLKQPLFQTVNSLLVSNNYSNSRESRIHPIQNYRLSGFYSNMYGYKSNNVKQTYAFKNIDSKIVIFKHAAYLHTRVLLFIYMPSLILHNLK